MNKSSLLMLLALPLLASCGKEAPNRPNLGEKFTIEASIGAYLRGAQLGQDGSGHFTPKTSLSLVVLKGNSFVKPLPFEVGQSLTWADFGLSETERQGKLAGVYPTQNVSKGRFTFDLQRSKEKDLLIAQEVAISKTMPKKEIALPFRHALHKLELRYTSSDGTYQAEQLQQLITLVRAKGSGEYDFLTGQMTPTGAKAEFRAVGKAATLLLIPQAVSDLELSIEIAGSKRTLSLADKKLSGKPLSQLEAGKVLTLEIDARRDKLVISTGNIAPWEQQGTINETIVL